MHERETRKPTFFAARRAPRISAVRAPWSDARTRGRREDEPFPAGPSRDPGGLAAPLTPVTR